MQQNAMLSGAKREVKWCKTRGEMQQNACFYAVNSTPEMCTKLINGC